MKPREIYEIRADYDASTIVVYQAYRPDIALAAVRRCGRVARPHQPECSSSTR